MFYHLSNRFLPVVKILTAMCLGPRHAALYFIVTVLAISFIICIIPLTAIGTER